MVQAQDMELGTQDVDVAGYAVQVTVRKSQRAAGVLNAEVHVVTEDGAELASTSTKARDWSTLGRSVWHAAYRLIDGLPYAVRDSISSGGVGLANQKG